MTRVVCVGDVMIDVLARLPGPLAVGSDTPAPIALYGGGSAANTAAWLATAGVPTTFVGRVGDDDLGRRAVAELQAAGVHTAVATDPVRPTGTCIVLVDVAGERTMVPAIGANAGLGDRPLPAELFGAGTHLHLSGYALFNEGARPAALAAIASTRGSGGTVSVDASSSAPLRELGPGTFLSWLGSPVLLVANLDEARVLAGADDPIGCARALGAACGEVIVKRGADGAVWSDGRAVVEAASVAVEIVDTTGAGDAFAAGVLAARLAGQDVRACLLAGARLAARAVARVGARP